MHFLSVYVSFLQLLFDTAEWVISVPTHTVHWNNEASSVFYLNIPSVHFPNTSAADNARKCDSASWDTIVRPVGQQKANRLVL